MTPADQHEGARPRLFALAYRMTGSVSEAEDLVQEAYFRLARARQGGVTVESPHAYLAATTTRLAIDHLRSARARRERYVGTWLPEPVVAGTGDDPERLAELSDSLSMAFLVLLERLSPVERAVFLLREVFDYPYDEIAEIVGKGAGNCRQILARARRHVDAHQTRHDASAAQAQALVHSFLSAARDGDLDQLVGLLAEDAVFYGDGGGKATAVRRPVRGRDRVAALVASLFRQAPRLGIAVAPAPVNGGPGILTRDPVGKVLSVFSLEVRDGAVHAVRGIVNPDKLRHLGDVSDLALLGRRRDDRPPRDGP